MAQSAGLVTERFRVRVRRHVPLSGAGSRGWYHRNRHGNVRSAKVAVAVAPGRLYARVAMIPLGALDPHRVLLRAPRKAPGPGSSSFIASGATSDTREPRLEHQSVPQFNAPAGAPRKTLPNAHNPTWHRQGQYQGITKGNGIS